MSANADIDDESITPTRMMEPPHIKLWDVEQIGLDIRQGVIYLHIKNRIHRLAYV
jgi:hypothetical protein